MDKLKSHVKNIFGTAIIFCQLSVFSQVGISETRITPDASAALEVRSENKGVLVPRMSSSQRMGISVGAASKGLLVYDNNTHSFWFYTGSAWTEIQDKFTTVGMIMAFPTQNLPDGWMALDGSYVSKNSYTELAAIYPHWVSGSNINLPDYRGYFVRGAGNNAADTSVRGDTNGGFQNYNTRKPRINNLLSDTLGNHTHTVSNISTESHKHTNITDVGVNTQGVLLYASLASILGVGRELADNVVTNESTSSAGTHSHTDVMPSDGNHSHTVNGGGDNETRPYSVGVVWAVRVKK